MPANAGMTRQLITCVARAESEGRLCRRVASARPIPFLRAACRLGRVLRGGCGFSRGCGIGGGAGTAPLSSHASAHLHSEPHTLTPTLRHCLFSCGCVLTPPPSPRCSRDSLAPPKTLNPEPHTGHGASRVAAGGWRPCVQPADGFDQGKPQLRHRRRGRRFAHACARDRVYC